MSPRDRRPDARADVRADAAPGDRGDGAVDPVRALTDFLAAVVEAPPRPSPEPSSEPAPEPKPEPGSEDELGQPGDRDRQGE